MGNCHFLIVIDYLLLINKKPRNIDRMNLLSKKANHFLNYSEFSTKFFYLVTDKEMSNTG